MLINNDAFLSCFGITSADDDDHLVEVARRAVRHGFAVVPIAAGGKKPLCTLTARQIKQEDTKARLAAQQAGARNWERVRHDCGIAHAITDPNVATRVVKRLIGEQGRINLGIEVGRSRMVLVDADTAEQVDAFYRDWASETGQDVTGRSPTVRTPGVLRDQEWVHKDGGHVWFSVPDGVDLSSLPGPGTSVADSGWVVFWKDRQALVPPSVRPEGAYQITGQVEPAPEWLLDRIQLAAHSYAERRQRQATRVLREGDPIDQWAAATEWGELLEPDGWTCTGIPDRCGCPIWTRPGNPAHNKSATAHELGCTRYDTDRTGHGPLHLWTDDPPDFLADAGKTLTKLDYVAWHDHSGNRSAAMSALGLEAVDEEGLTRQERLAQWLKALAGSPAGTDEPVEDPQDAPETPESDSEATEGAEPPGKPPDALEQLQQRIESLPPELRQEAFRVASNVLAREQVDAWRQELSLSDLVSNEPYRMWSLADLDELDPPRWRIKGVLPDDSFTLLFGPTGTLKSFVAIDWSLSIAAGVSWHGHDAHQGGVLYVAAEGGSGIRKRAAAWRVTYPDADPEGHFHVLPHRVRLSDPVAMRRLAITLEQYAEQLDEPPALIGIDTWSRNTPGVDENDSKYQSKLIDDLVDDLAHRIGCGVLVVHHSGHEKGRERGSTALPAAADARWETKRKPKDKQLKLINHKLKEWEEADDIDLITHLVQLDERYATEDDPNPASLVLLQRDPVMSFLPHDHEHPAVVDALKGQGPLSQSKLEDRLSGRRETRRLIAQSAANCDDCPVTSWQTGDRTFYALEDEVLP